MCRSVFGFGLIAALLLGSTTRATQYAYRVTFTDKNNTPYSLSSPSAFLSARALARRATQGIAIDSADLPVDASYVDSVLALTGGKLHETSRWLNTCVILVNDTSQVLPLGGKAFINNIKCVGVYGVPLHKNSGGTPITFNHPAGKTTAFDASYYGAAWDQTKLVNGNTLHTNGHTGKGKLIAVLDAGFIGAKATGFDTLWMNNRVVDTFNFAYRNENTFTQDSHGTQVLSTMAGNIPGSYVGSAPDAMYALYLTEVNGDDQPMELDNLLSATERADSIGADIVTISLGYDLFENPADGQNFADLDGKTTVGAKAANMATKKGMLFVATAGNDGAPPIPGWGNHILTPGDADSALTIGAATPTGGPAAISGYGPNAAGHVKPDVCGLGQPAAIINNGVITSSSGTSFSTPQIAGWAACLWGANPTATPYQLRQAIVKCASTYTTPGPQLGYGVANFDCTQLVLKTNEPKPPFTPANWVIATPNPFTSELILSVSPDTNQDVNFELCDMTGKTIISFTRSLNKGNNTPITISMPWLSAGIYILKAVSATQQQTVRIQKK